MQLHLDYLIQDHLAQGLSPAEARRAAHKEFGTEDQYREEVRDSWRPALLADLVADFRFSLRQLRKSWGFTAVIVLTLAIGIGASTAIFSIVNSVALQPLNYVNPDQLIELRQIRPIDGREFSPSLETVRELRERTTVFSDITATSSMLGNLTGVDYPVRIFGNAVTINYFSALGVEPMLGRTFTREEGVEGKSNVVILNHAFWLNQFNGNPDVINQVVLLNDEPFTVIGVMPPGFRTEAGAPKTFVPLVVGPVLRNTGFLLAAHARLKPGVTIEQAQAEIDVLARNLAQSDPENWEGFAARIVPLLDFRVGQVRPTLFVLLAAAGFLLLVACVNVANLLLARASTRQREIALRSALGADRKRIVRQLLAESLTLALIGGLLGATLAWGSMNLLLSFAPVDLPRVDEIRLDHIALLFGFGITLFTGVGFGIVPAIQASKVDLTTALKEGGRGAGESKRNARIRSSLVVAEIALALVLLIGAGLLSRTFANLQNTELGYDGDVIHADRLRMLEHKYPDNQSRIDFAYRALAQIQTKPEIVSAAFTSGLPYFGAFRFRLDIESRPESDPAKMPFVMVSSGTPDFFDVIGSPLIRGRQFNDRDREDTPLVAIITAQLAQQIFGEADPIGKRIAITRDTSREWREIVGVASNIKWFGVTNDNAPMIYVPFRQNITGQNPKVVVRVRPGSPNPGAVVASAIHAVDADMPMSAQMPRLDEYDANSIAIQRFTLFLFAAFSGIALLLAALGIFGVMSYSVSQRTNEIAVRLALGAQSNDILKLILLKATRLIVVGIGIGIIGAIAGSRFLASVLYNVSALDPITFGGISVLLAAIAAISCYLPARRATKVSLLVALRSD
ncbi:MAG: ABC transporter permease [Synoicihabitans sp.]